MAEEFDMHTLFFPEGLRVPLHRPDKFLSGHPHRLDDIIVGIGHVLSDGKPHDDRAADYDDWNLNGDLLYYNELLDCADG